jgi:hypothetical protein
VFPPCHYIFVSLLLSISTPVPKQKSMLTH